MTQKTFPPGTLILREGETGDAAYLIMSGKVEIFRAVDGKKFVINRVGPGAVIGEMAIIDNKPRMACAVAMEPTECVVITRDAFAQAFNKAAPLVQYMLQTQINALRSLAGVSDEPAPIVAGTSIARSHRSSNEVMRRKLFPVDKQIINQGDAAENVYLVQEGEVLIYRDDPKGEREIVRVVGPGGVVGDMALIDRKPYDVSATAVKATTCEVLHHSVFDKLLSEAAPILRAMLKSYTVYVQHLRARKT